MTAREAAVEEFPISKGIARVSMGLEPEAMREPHWHATAAEWAYVDKSRVRTTVVAPKGRLRPLRISSRASWSSSENRSQQRQ